MIELRRTRPVNHAPIAVLMLVGLVLGSLVMGTSAQAQTQTQPEITLTPTAKEHEVDPGEQVNDKFQIYNTGQVEYEFQVYARPFSVVGESYKQDFSTVEPRSDAYEWVQFEKTQYRLQPGEHVDVNYTLRIPDNASPGGHYGILFSEIQPTKNQDGTAIAAKSRVGAVLRVRVSGDVERSGQYLDSTINFFQFRSPLTVASRVDNTGNVDSKATVDLVVKDVFGNTKYSLSQPYVIYPGKIRAMQPTWESVNWFGLYRVEVSTEFLDSTGVHSQLVLMAPRWLLVAIGLAIVGGGYALFRRRS